MESFTEMGGRGQVQVGVVGERGGGNAVPLWTQEVCSAH